MGDEAAMEVVYLDGEEETTNWISRAGLARVTYPSGAVFEGSFNEAKQKSGKGKYTFPQSEDAEEDAPVAEYEGNYEEGKRNGMGTMRYADNSLYRGEWKDGLRHGQGAMTYSNDDIYSGGWQDDKRDSMGTYLFAASGAELKGIWENGEITKGTFKHSDGTNYDGYFVQNKMSGVGTHNFANGLVLEGEFIQKIVPMDEEEDLFRNKWVTSSA